VSAGVFPFIPRRRVVGLAFGGLRSVRRGVGSDIATSREYRPGDDVGWMDWAASAKLSAARSSDEFIVRERFADEAPRVVALCDRRPSMAIRASALRHLDKPRAVFTALELIGASAQAARSPSGYVDHAEGDVFWRPPRSEQLADPETFDRPFEAPDDTVSRALEFLGDRRRELPTQAFVFVISDFLVPPDIHVWERALEHRWEIVPVIVQDPVWERTFPDIGGITISYAEPESGNLVPIHLTRDEANRRRDQHEVRFDGLLGAFRSLGTEPVTVKSHDPVAMLKAFLDWADLRVLWHGALAG
jgi:uncharacterized protein (DUF58 family)